MATKRQVPPSHAGAQKDDLTRCKRNLRLLLGHLSQSLPQHRTAFQSVFLLHFQQAVDNPNFIKQSKGAFHHGRR